MASKKTAQPSKKSLAPRRERSISVRAGESVKDEPSIKSAKDKLIKEKGTRETTISLIHWTEGDPRTPFSATLLQHTVRAKVMRTQALQLIERLRCAAQPNATFRRQRLVPCDVGQRSDRATMIEALRDCAEPCFDNAPILANYISEIIKMEEEVDKAQDVFLRQVMMYCVQPLRSFAEGEYAAITREYEALEKRRQEYDDARKRFGKPIFPAVAVDPRLARAKQSLADQARVLELLFERTPRVQMGFAKATATFVLAEAAYYEKIHKLTNAIRPPDSPHRLKASPKR